MFDSDLAKDGELRRITRRSFVFTAAAGAAGLAFWSMRKPGLVEANGSASSQAPKEVVIVQFSDSGQRMGTAKLPKIVKSESEWRKQLSLGAFAITRHSDTEFAYSGEYWNLHDKGLYRCICCDTALFSSETKFDSGTGWPSFWQPIAKENVENIEDRTLGVLRTAVSCRRCDAHLGHVFDDGPQPTGLRYCMNSASLRFIKFA